MPSDARPTSVAHSPKELSARASKSPVQTTRKPRPPAATLDETTLTSGRRRPTKEYKEKEQLSTHRSPQQQLGTTQTQTTSKRRTNRLLLQEDATRDSMVDSLLLSFNNIPHAQGPYPKQLPYLSPFEEYVLLQFHR